MVKCTTMDINEVTSGDEYADLLISKMKKIHEEAGKEGLHPTVFKNWCKSIRQMCRKSYLAYEKGITSDYKISDEEMGNAYEQAVSDYVDEMLEGLIDRGLVEMAVSEEGGIVYGLSDKGKGYANVLKDIMGDDDDDDDDF